MASPGGPEAWMWGPPLVSPQGADGSRLTAVTVDQDVERSTHTRCHEHLSRPHPGPSARVLGSWADPLHARGGCAWKPVCPPGEENAFAW